jgi:hypothetical protein
VTEIPLSHPLWRLAFGILYVVLQRNVIMAAYRFADGDGHVGKDATNIPDYVAIALLLMMPLAALWWFAERKFEL